MIRFNGQEIQRKPDGELDISPEARDAFLKAVDQNEPWLYDMFDGLDPQDKKRIGRLFKEPLKIRLRDLNDKQAEVQKKIAGTDDLCEWLKRDKFDIRRNECSRMHHLIEAQEQGRVHCIYELPEGYKPSNKSDGIKAHIPFVVQHDWARAFEGATDFSSGDYQLPYDDCAFEFDIGGKIVIVIASNQVMPEGGQPWVEFVKCGDQWFFGFDGFEGLVDLKQHVRAICIALEAEAATHAVMRQPHALQVAREKKGKLPLFDYHIVSLAKRYRAESSGGSGESGGRKRLHFRRGHWRHFETHKTWIKWMLVGNPDLGFIGKEYRL